MSRLPAAFLVRLAAQTSCDPGLLQAVTRRRLAAVPAVLPQLPPKVRDLLAQRRVVRPQNLNLAPQRANQVANLGSENDPYLDLYFPARRPKKSHALTAFSPKTVAHETYPQLGSYLSIIGFAHKPLKNPCFSEEKSSDSASPGFLISF